MSAVFSSSYILKVLDVIIKKHTIVLSTYIVDELKRVVLVKFPDKNDAIQDFLLRLPYELVKTSDTIDVSIYPYIRDIKDLPVLVSAIDYDVDVLLTGDKDFSQINIKRPEVLTPKEFLAKYG
jgi:predicted nucleic acid-binding protein